MRTRHGIQRGDRLTIVNADGLPKDLAKVMKPGRVVNCRAVSASGAVQTDAFPGWFRPHRFEHHRD